MVIQAKGGASSESANGDDLEATESLATQKSVRFLIRFLENLFLLDFIILENRIGNERPQCSEETEAAVDAIFRSRFPGNSLRKPSVFLQRQDSDTSEGLRSDVFRASHQEHQRQHERNNLRSAGDSHTTSLPRIPLCSRISFFVKNPFRSVFPLCRLFPPFLNFSFSISGTEDLP